MINTMLVMKVVCAAFATVGIVEYLKNFITFNNKKIWAYVMIPICALCFFAADKLPVWVIGSLLTVGTVQICYQTLIQGFTAIIKNVTSRTYRGSNEHTGHEEEGISYDSGDM